MHFYPHGTVRICSFLWLSMTVTLLIRLANQGSIANNCLSNMSSCCFNVCWKLEKSARQNYCFFDNIKKCSHRSRSNSIIKAGSRNQFRLAAASGLQRSLVEKQSLFDFWVMLAFFLACVVPLAALATLPLLGVLRRAKVFGRSQGLQRKHKCKACQKTGHRLETCTSPCIVCSTNVIVLESMRRVQRCVWSVARTLLCWNRCIECSDVYGL